MVGARRFENAAVLFEFGYSGSGTCSCWSRMLVGADWSPRTSSLVEAAVLAVALGLHDLVLLALNCQLD